MERRPMGLSQRSVLALIKEAADPKCTAIRLVLIDRELQAATAYATKGCKPNTPEYGLLELVKTLFVETLKNRPDLLLGLFPVFSMICTDSNRGTDELLTTTGVDWYAVPVPEKPATPEEG
ncbi:MAG: hypothetical protein UT32_C0002G0008 [Parcubacteria group bacterium GW2011_GWC2_39_14]|nr:MAG: hypothetical protein UT32_C0002G0008 [Parcubacteria group bacterium GW2011_GWC2_39_14]KKR55233.1 MAG: hypothetical protein UT91_C0003G0008 [Parcubacteria group bacterium GW2011_GWA2_40_23]